MAGKVAAEVLMKNDMSLIKNYDREWQESLGARHHRYYKIKKVIYKFRDSDLNSIAATMSKLPESDQTLGALSSRR